MVKTRALGEIAPDLLDRLKARFGGFPLVQGWGLSIEASVIRASPRSAVLECKLLCGERVMALGTAHFIITVRAGVKP